MSSLLHFDHISTFLRMSVRCNEVSDYFHGLMYSCYNRWLWSFLRISIDVAMLWTDILPGGHWPRKGVWGCAALKTPFSRLSCRLQGSHFKQKSQFTRPLLRKFANFSLYSLNFHPNFSSQAPKFGNFQLTSPQIWKFSAHKPPFSEANVSSQAPHFGNPGRTPLPKKKLSAPPPPRIYFQLIWSSFNDVTMMEIATWVFSMYECT